MKVAVFGRVWMNVAVLALDKQCLSPRRDMNLIAFELWTYWGLNVQATQEHHEPYCSRPGRGGVLGRKEAS